MSARRRLLSRVTLLKTQLAGGDRVQQAFVPLAEAVEVSLSHGMPSSAGRDDGWLSPSAGVSPRWLCHMPAMALPCQS